MMKIKNIAFILGVCIMSFSVGYFVFAWTGPSEEPAGGNVSAPINISNSGQIKLGTLRVGGFTSDSTTYLATQSGNVGIGTTDPKTKLDVAGAIKIGSEDTCDATTEGAIRYNSSEKQIEGCDGTSWSSISIQFTCGDTVTFTYKSIPVTYGTVLGANNECWLDRNLGASQVAIAYNDSQAYGDLFQWGRLDDGHQVRTSGTTITLSSSDIPGHSNFIKSANSPWDWRSPQNNNLWQGVSGINNPCPSGWRLPTSAEWDTERASWSSKNYNGAFASPLKLTAAGSRRDSTAALRNVGSYGNYWSSTVSSGDAFNLFFTISTAGNSMFSRANGCSIRCIKDI